uniref:Uncharacterized protein n=1 Tax=Amphimedon queenslandica TaxID=400682 RepID=A0A1X7SXP9_AMPQE
MCINKDLKSAVTYPTEAYLQKTSLFMNSRVKLSKNLFNQLFPEQNSIEGVPEIIDNSSDSVKLEKDIIKMIEIIQENNLLPANLVEDCGLLNTFNGQAATLEQQYDLLHFRRIGEEANTSYINHQILRQTFAATMTIRRKKLL